MRRGNNRPNLLVREVRAHRWHALRVGLQQDGGKGEQDKSDAPARWREKNIRDPLFIEASPASATNLGPGAMGSVSIVRQVTAVRRQSTG